MYMYASNCNCQVRSSRFSAPWRPPAPVEPAQPWPSPSPSPAPQERKVYDTIPYYNILTYYSIVHYSIIYYTISILEYTVAHGIPHHIYIYIYLAGQRCFNKATPPPPPPARPVFVMLAKLRVLFSCWAWPLLMLVFSSLCSTWLVFMLPLLSICQPESPQLKKVIPDVGGPALGSGAGAGAGALAPAFALGSACKARELREYTCGALSAPKP